MRRISLLSIATAASLLAGRTPVEAGTDEDGFSFATFARGPSHPRFGTSGTLDNFKTLRPGQKFDFFSHTSECSCPGWRTVATITFNSAITFRDAEYNYYFPRREVTPTSVTLGADRLGGIFLVVPFEVKPVDQLGAETEARVRVDLEVTNPQGAVCTDSIEYAVPILGLPLGVSVDAVTPRPGYVRPGDEVAWRVVGNPGDRVNTMTIENPLPDRKLATLVPGSASPAAQVQGGKLVWTFRDVDTPQVVTFRTKMADQFPAKLKEISDTATVRVSTGKSKSATKKVPVASATLVVGVVKDPIVDFPRRTSVLLRPPTSPKGGNRPVRARLLRKSNGSEVDAADLDRDGAYALEATESGAYEVRIETDADRYSPTTNAVDAGVARLVQKRDVTVPPVAQNPNGDPVEVDDILLPISLANDIAQRLYRLNHMAPKFSGFVPLPTSFDTDGIPAQVEALLADADEAFERIYDGTGARDGWNAAIRLDAVLALVEARFLDNARLADVFSKSVSLLVTIEVMKKLGPKIVDRWKAANGDPKFVPADMKSRTIEAVKIATLAYGVGYILPKLLEQTKLTSEQKALVIESVAKAVRFGLNTFVAAQNQQDVVFEAIFQVMRAAIFAGFNEGIFIPIVERELARASGLFANRAIAEDTTATLQWLALYDERVGNRSKENFGVAGDALKKLSLFVRGLDGVLFKAQQAMGYSGNAAIKGTLRDNTNALLKFLEKPKLAATMTAFSLAIGAPLMEQAYLYQDVEVEVSAAFSGPSGLGPPVPPGEGLASSVGNELLRDIDFLFGTRYAPTPAKPGSVPVTPPVPEVAAYLAALDGVEAAVAAGDVPAYETARTSLLASHDAFLGRLRTPAEKALRVLSADSTADDVLVGLQGARYEAGSTIGLLYEYLEVWAAEPTRPNAKSALAAATALRRTLATVSGAIVGSEAALARRQVPAVLVVTGGPDGEDVAAAATVTLSFTVRNVGDVASAAATARLETTDALTVLGPAELQVPALAPGATATLDFPVTTGAARRAASYVLLIRLPDGAFAPQEGYVVVEP